VQAKRRISKTGDALCGIAGLLSVEFALEPGSLSDGCVVLRAAFAETAITTN
jgi:hypothetical protein